LPNKVHSQYRVAYADTDQMGVVYYANYLTFFERARTEFLRKIGFEYKRLELLGFALPVLESHVFYHAAASYDDLLDFYSWVDNIKGVRLRMNCELFCKGKLLADGYTVHAFVNKDSMRPVRIIKEFRELCEQFINLGDV